MTWVQKPGELLHIFSIPVKPAHHLKTFSWKMVPKILCFLFRMSKHVGTVHFWCCSALVFSKLPFSCMQPIMKFQFLHPMNGSWWIKYFACCSHFLKSQKKLVVNSPCFHQSFQTLQHWTDILTNVTSRLRGLHTKGWATKCTEESIFSTTAWR